MEIILLKIGNSLWVSADGSEGMLGRENYSVCLTVMLKSFVRTTIQKFFYSTINST